MRRELTPEQGALLILTKTIHRRARLAMEAGRKKGGQAHRHALLASAYVRGLTYRRVEPRRRFQKVGGFYADRAGEMCAVTLLEPYEHNAPKPSEILDLVREICTVDGVLRSPFEFGTSLLPADTREVIARGDANRGPWLTLEEIREWCGEPLDRASWRFLLELECKRLKRQRDAAAEAAAPAAE